MVFAIAEQAAGAVTFSVGVEAPHAPSNLYVTCQQFDSMSQLASEQDRPVGEWVDDNGLWIGYAAFSVTSGRACFAYVHKGGSPQPLETFSYVVP